MKLKRFAIFALVFMAFGYSIYAQQLTVAVSPFEARSGMSKDDAETVTELFIAQLVADRTIRVVDRNNFDKIIAEMRFQTSDWADSNRVAELGRATGANSIIRGTVATLAGQTVITATILDINTAQILSSSTLRMANMREIFDKLPTFASDIVSNLPNSQRANTPAASASTGIAIEVSTNIGGTIHFEGKEIATLWENDTHTIPIERPGTYTVMLILADGQALTKNVTINTRGISKVEFKVYKIGDRGPGGGLVFYALNGTYKECSGIDLGSGDRNQAVTIAQNYRGGGFSNWRLPDQGELDLMYRNLKLKGLGGFSDGWYCSSSQTETYSFPFIKRFSDGSGDYDGRNRSPYLVRAIRSFN